MKDFYRLSERGRALRLRRVVQAALAEYPLDCLHLRLITNDQNGVFRVEARDGSRYVMRVYLPHPHAVDTARAEAAWLEALAQETELLVPRPVRTTIGAYHCLAAACGVPEQRCCALFSWIPGSTLDQKLNPENMRRFGSLTARLHLHAAQFKLPEGLAVTYRYDQPFPFDEPVLLFEPCYSHLLPPGRLELFHYTRDLVQQAIERLEASCEPPRLLHGDLHRWNVKVYRGRLGVLDFEDMLWGWPVQDIGTSMLYFYGDENYQAHRQAFMEGYASVTDWPERSAGEVDVFMAGRNLVLANTVLQESKPEWKEMAPRYFARVERRLRALLLGEGEFKSHEW